MKTIGMKTKKTVNQKLKRIFLSLLLPAAMTASVTCNAPRQLGHTAAPDARGFV